MSLNIVVAVKQVMDPEIPHSAFSISDNNKEVVSPTFVAYYYLGATATTGRPSSSTDFAKAGSYTRVAAFE